MTTKLTQNSNWEMQETRGTGRTQDTTREPKVSLAQTCSGHLELGAVTLSRWTFLLPAGPIPWAKNIK
eukprot:8857540-Prorocentrum_lima.AAC.1